MLKSEPYFWVVCDYPDCDAASGDDSDYSAWSDPSAAEESASNSDWLVTDDDKHYCFRHWDTDEEGESVPLPTDIDGRFLAMQRKLASSLYSKAERAYRIISQSHGGTIDRNILHNRVARSRKWDYLQ